MTRITSYESESELLFYDFRIDLELLFYDFRIDLEHSIYDFRIDLEHSIYAHSIGVNNFRFGFGAIFTNKRSKTNTYKN